MKTLSSLLLAAVTMGAVLPAVPALAAVKGPGFTLDLGQTLTVDRRRPRVPGGSGCDDPRDLIEHPECRR